MQSCNAQTLVGVGKGLKFGKCPRWNGQSLIFLDVDDRSIKTVASAGDLHTEMRFSFLPGGFDLQENGDFVVTDALHARVHKFSTDGRASFFDLSDALRFRPGEVAVDHRGGVYVSDIGFDFLDPMIDPTANGIIIYLDADGRSSVVADNLSQPDGLAITPDNQTLIVCESLAHRLTAFDVDENGALQHRRVWAQLEDTVKLHGICIDGEDRVWVAGGNLFAPLVREGGAIARRVTTQRSVFGVALGGLDQRQLFLCTATSNDPLIFRRGASASIETAAIAGPDYRET